MDDTRTTLQAAAFRLSQTVCAEALTEPARARDAAAAAKLALEAAALVGQTPISEIDDALAKIGTVLERAGVLDEAEQLPAHEFLQRALEAMLAWREEAIAAQGYQAAYDGLVSFLQRLERDFAAGDSPTSTRIAGRIETALNSAANLVHHVNQGDATDGHEYHPEAQ